MNSRHDNGDGANRDLLAACLLNAGRTKELSQLRCDDADVCYWQGLAYAQQGLSDQAIVRLRQALIQQPDHQRAQTALTTLDEQLFLTQVAEENLLSGVNGHFDAQSLNTVEVTAHQPAHDDTKLIKTVIALLAGQREEAVDIMQNALNRDPNDSTVLHSLGLASYYAARVLSKRGCYTAAEHFWRRVVAVWVAILNGDTIYEGWQALIETRYQVEIAARDMSLFRKELEDNLIRMLLHVSEQINAADGQDNHHHHQDLRVRNSGYERLLQREMKAAATLRRVGGFAVPGATFKKLICGPLMIQLLGYETEFGQFIADLEVREDAVSDDVFELLQSLLQEDWKHFEQQLPPLPSQKRQLKRYFSQLGMAQALLDLSRPEEALEALTNISCDVCRNHTQPRPSTFVEGEIIECEAGCPNFDRANSSYAGLVDKESYLILDAVELAVEAHLAAAQLTLTAAEMNVETVCTHWKQALWMASELGADYRENTQHQIVNAALGRCAALQNDRRSDEAIAVLERAEHICEHRHKQEIRSRLAELFTHRGITAGNKQPPDWSAAVRDLRRAVDLNGHALRTRINLCIALNAWAGEELDRNKEESVIKLLEEVVQRVNKAGSAGVDHPALQRELEVANDELSRIYNSRAVRLAGQANWTGAVREIDSANMLAPRSEIVHENVRRIYRSYALSLFERGHTSECVQVLKTLVGRYPNDWATQKDLEEVLLVLRAMEQRR